MESNKDIKIKNPINRGGRPRKKEEDKVCKRFEVRFTESDSKIVKERLLTFGYKNFSQFCYDALVRGNIVVEKTVLLDEKTNEEIRKIGININQLAKRNNSVVGYDWDYLKQEVYKIKRSILSLRLSLEQKK